MVRFSGCPQLPSVEAQQVSEMWGLVLWASEESLVAFLG